MDIAVIQKTVLQQVALHSISSWLQEDKIKNKENLLLIITTKYTLSPSLRCSVCTGDEAAIYPSYIIVLKITRKIKRLDNTNKNT